MKAVKLKARIGADAILEWLDPLPDLPAGEVEIILLYEQNQVFPDQNDSAAAQEIADLDADAGWGDLENDPEWLALTPEERAGQARRDLTPDEIASRLEWIDANAGCIHLPADEAMRIAMDAWLAEENLDL